MSRFATAAATAMAAALTLASAAPAGAQQQALRLGRSRWSAEAWIH
jgi:hypothetical protein